MDMDLDMEVRSSPPTQLLYGARDGVREQDTHPSWLVLLFDSAQSTTHEKLTRLGLFWMD